MALSATCPKCPGTSFDLKIVEPRGSSVKMRFLCCTLCGATVGVTDFYVVQDGATLARRVEAIGNTVDAIASAVSAIEHRLRTTGR